MNRLKLARQSGEKRTYTIEADPNVLNELEKFFSDLNYLGSAGASRSLSMFIDGDGAFWVDIKKKDGDLSKGNVIDSDDISYDFD